ncbi:hypothetical protein HAX54_047309 [Datura stramonium]|uniref:Uncharacterized protein n=1 Tax=Datura stramonium TaxID=4076 RepID=A0ABS8WI53_DATST|nr:hypothetical protein [Datura stramonium]
MLKKKDMAFTYFVGACSNKYVLGLFLLCLICEIKYDSKIKGVTSDTTPNRRRISTQRQKEEEASIKSSSKLVVLVELVVVLAESKETSSQRHTDARLVPKKKEQSLNKKQQGQISLEEEVEDARGDSSKNVDASVDKSKSNEDGGGEDE